MRNNKLKKVISNAINNFAAYINDANDKVIKYKPSNMDSVILNEGTHRDAMEDNKGNSVNYASNIVDSIYRHEGTLKINDKLSFNDLEFIEPEFFMTNMQPGQAYGINETKSKVNSLDESIFDADKKSYHRIILNLVGNNFMKLHEYIVADPQDERLSVPQKHTNKPTNVVFVDAAENMRNRSMNYIMTGDENRNGRDWQMMEHEKLESKVHDLAQRAADSSSMKINVGYFIKKDKHSDRFGAA